VDLDKPAFVGRDALLAERARGGPSRRLVGLVLDWDGIERLSVARGLPPVMSSNVSRSPVPVFDAFHRQVGRVTSSGWSPTLKQLIALASVAPRFAPPGGRVDVEWSVEGRRGTVPARVVELPFLDLPRRRG
jgi:aminomethyltransferase